MPRAPTTQDAFNAVAERKRRQLLEVLADGEQPVNEMVALLDWPQPTLSKHLGVLKRVGLVTMRQQGRQRLYRLNAEPLRLIHDWAETFECFWRQQLDVVKERAEQRMKSRNRSHELEDKRNSQP